jgi:hypothetical protein
MIWAVLFLIFLFVVAAVSQPQADQATATQIKQFEQQDIDNRKQCIDTIANLEQQLEAIQQLIDHQHYVLDCIDNPPPEPRRCSKRRVV